ncbi:hypothetical protein MTR67_002146 [Solanum verrucosum]|uniref:Integrase zinc-binding domain-containing protein n=1 Tax=Solanum verrucosum TaxID=315347 RepID=A0AAF0PQD9_SOLVR|nr:hypothetical protein MTR67_002146 [Solanum verrucosum]
MDYDMSILYYQGKANVVVDTLSKFSIGSNTHVEDVKKELAKEVHGLARLGVRLLDSSECRVVAYDYKQKVMAFEQKGDGVLKYQGRLFVPKVDEIQERIMVEPHSSGYAIPTGSIKMYHDLREVYWWNSMKRCIAYFVAKCPNVQQVKEEHQRLGCVTQNIVLPEWKWEMINIDFITGLSRSRTQHYSIWAVMRFGKKGKPSPQYIGPYRISKRVGNVANELEFVPELVVVHLVFHISMLMN